jgi:hypothetical protein
MRTGWPVDASGRSPESYPSGRGTGIRRLPRYLTQRASCCRYPGIRRLTGQRISVSTCTRCNARTSMYNAGTAFIRIRRHRCGNDSDHRRTAIISGISAPAITWIPAPAIAIARIPAPAVARVTSVPGTSIPGTVVVIVVMVVVPPRHRTAPAYGGNSADNRGDYDAR